MLRKLSLFFGLVIAVPALLLPAFGKTPETPEALIEQAVGYLNDHKWENWIDLWVPEDRAAFRKELKEKPADTGLKNIKTAKLIRQVDVTGKIPVNPNYPFVDVRVYYFEMDLAVKKEVPGFKNGRNNHLVLLLKKTPNDPWAIRQWGASPALEELLKPRKASPKKQST